MFAVSPLNRFFIDNADHAARLVDVPFPTERLAQAAITSLSVDEELSMLVRRTFVLIESMQQHDHEKTVLRIEYRATTDRMLRVAVNGFFESLGVVIQIMEELDADVLGAPSSEDLTGVQGVENVSDTQPVAAT